MDEKEIPPLHYLYSYITDGCNLRCRHCWIKPHYIAQEKGVNYLNAELFSHILEEALPLGLKGVKLTGGEPLLHPELIKILSTIRRLNLELTLETNGTLIGENVVAALCEHSVLHVSVSLDGATPETNDHIRNVKGAFKHTISGIERLVSSNLRPQIIFTLMESNKEEVTAIVKLAQEVGACSVKINCLQPVARGKKIFSRGGAVPVEEILTISRMVDEELTSPALPVSVHLPLAFRPLSQIFSQKGDACATCGILGILGLLADGSYALCGIGEIVKEMVFGRAQDHSVKEIWSESKILKEIRRGLPGRLKGTCRRCILKGICLGSCLAQNFYRRRDVWSPFWFCEEAEAQGLFPTSRLTSLSGGK
ncbi:MAG: SynChlorMet cassette radical SAM/SPASM protein ScmF [Syntrophales bacterium]|nr:SynChlorMet cassette radical SAM/SPASM protein ScmF [Syntrophales bacterium]